MVMKFVSDHFIYDIELSFQSNRILISFHESMLIYSFPPFFIFVESQFSPLFFKKFSTFALCVCVFERQRERDLLLGPNRMMMGRWRRRGRNFRDDHKTLIEELTVVGWIVFSEQKRHTVTGRTAMETMPTALALSLNRRRRHWRDQGQYGFRQSTRTILKQFPQHPGHSLLLRHLIPNTKAQSTLDILKTKFQICE